QCYPGSYPAKGISHRGMKAGDGSSARRRRHGDRDCVPETGHHSGSAPKIIRTYDHAEQNRMSDATMAVTPRRSTPRTAALLRAALRRQELAGTSQHRLVAPIERVSPLPIVVNKTG